MTNPKTPIPNTYDISRYMDDIIVYRDGRVEKEPVYSYEGYIKELDNEVSIIEENLVGADPEDILAGLRKLTSIETLKQVLKIINEDYEE